MDGLLTAMGKRSIEPGPWPVHRMPRSSSWQHGMIGAREHP